MFDKTSEIRFLKARINDLRSDVYDTNARLRTESHNRKKDIEALTKQLFEATTKPKYKVGEKIGGYTVQDVIVAIEFSSDGSKYTDYYYIYTLLSKDLLEFISRNEKEIEAIK